jgi:hypothetical protein
MLAAGSGGVSGHGVSDESVNAAVTIGSGSGGTGVASAAGASDLLLVTMSALLAVTTSAAANAIGGNVLAILASAAGTGATWSMMGAAPEPNPTSHTRTEAGIATSRPSVAIAANCEFMITVSNRTGLNRQARDASHLGVAIWTSNGGNGGYPVFQQDVA